MAIAIPERSSSRWLAGDLIVASESAKFADTHARWALTPIWGMSQRLPPRVRPAESRPVVETVEPDQLQPSGEPLSVRSGAFRALRHRNYRLYFFGQLVSLAGTWMQSAAQAWLVLKLTNSSMMLGVVSFAQFTPILLVGLFAGVLIDRVDRRRLIITTQIMLMLSAFTLAALTWTGTVRVS